MYGIFCAIQARQIDNIKLIYKDKYKILIDVFSIIYNLFRREKNETY